MIPHFLSSPFSLPLAAIVAVTNISSSALWMQNGVTIAGGQGQGNRTNQLNNTGGICVDDSQAVLIADVHNHRVMKWKNEDTNGEVVAGGNGEGNGLNQLSKPSDILIDKRTNGLIICDRGNRRVVRWSRRQGTTEGKVLISNISCLGLAMDHDRNLYVSDVDQAAVRRYRIGSKHFSLVAGGQGNGSALNQLSHPAAIVVDRQQTVYVADKNNNRVMKWKKCATQGILVAEIERARSSLAKLRGPHGLFLDALETLYIADSLNQRVVRWPKGAQNGTVVVGGNGRGEGTNQFKGLTGLFIDRSGQLYVADRWNNRVQRFSIAGESRCCISV